MRRLIPSTTRFAFALVIGVLTLVAASLAGAPAGAQDAGDVWTIYTNSNAVQALAVDPMSREIWAATTGGVVRWDPNTGTYTRYTVSDGLADNEVQAVAIDTDGNKWFGSLYLTRLAPDGTWTTYSPDTSGIGGQYIN